MQVNLSLKDIKIINKSLAIRVDELNRFADECAFNKQKACSQEFTDMARDCKKVLDKFESLLD